MAFYRLRLGLTECCRLTMVREVYLGILRFTRYVIIILLYVGQDRLLCLLCESSNIPLPYNSKDTVFLQCAYLLFFITVLARTALCTNSQQIMTDTASLWVKLCGIRKLKSNDSCLHSHKWVTSSLLYMYICKCEITQIFSIVEIVSTIDIEVSRLAIVCPFLF